MGIYDGVSCVGMYEGWVVWVCTRGELCGCVFGLAEMVPYVLYGVSPREAGGVHFETINLNTQVQWFDNPSPSKSIV